MALDALIKQTPSPNFGPRRDGAKPNLIVLHYTAMGSCEAARARLCSSEFEVSAHYLISENGDILQMVTEDMRAWHAGAGAWGACVDINSNSIGIELDNTGVTPFSEPMMASLEALMPQIMERWDIDAKRVIGHSDMAPDRKFDPGCRFDWKRLASQGLAVWPEKSSENLGPDFEQWRRIAAQFGYTSQPSISNEAVLRAFRDRFRAGSKRPLDREDMRVIQDLARRFPVDDLSTKP